MLKFSKLCSPKIVMSRLSVLRNKFTYPTIFHTKYFVITLIVFMTWIHISTFLLSNLYSNELSQSSWFTLIIWICFLKFFIPNLPRLVWGTPWCEILIYNHGQDDGWFGLLDGLSWNSFTLNSLFLNDGCYTFQLNFTRDSQITLMY